MILKAKQKGISPIIQGLKSDYCRYIHVKCLYTIIFCGFSSDLNTSSSSITECLCNIHHILFLTWRYTNPFNFSRLYYMQMRQTYKRTSPNLYWSWTTWQVQHELNYSLAVEKSRICIILKLERVNPVFFIIILFLTKKLHRHLGIVRLLYMDKWLWENFNIFKSEAKIVKYMFKLSLQTQNDVICFYFLFYYH